MRAGSLSQFLGGFRGKGGSGSDPEQADGWASGGEARFAPESDQRPEEAGDQGEDRRSDQAGAFLLLASIRLMVRKLCNPS
jgi:hypothetical protein